MQKNQKGSEFYRKIMTFSPSTIKTLMTISNTPKNTKKTHKIVMESTTEEEVLQKMEQMSKSR